MQTIISRPTHCSKLRRASLSVSNSKQANVEALSLADPVPDVIGAGLAQWYSSHKKKYQEGNAQLDAYAQSDLSHARDIATCTVADTRSAAQ